MTTLIVTPEGFYSDGRVTAGFDIVSDCRSKVFEHNGCAVGVTGTVDGLEWLAKRYIDTGLTDPHPDMLNEEGQFVMHQEGVFKTGHLKQDGTLEINLISDTGIYGSGAPYAQAAMDFGRTPQEAIEYAMTRDAATGGQVFSVMFADL